MEDLGSYEPDTIFTTQKPLHNDTTHYLPFGINDFFLTMNKNTYFTNREYDFTHIFGPGYFRRQMANAMRFLPGNNYNNKVYGNTVSSSYLHGLYVQSSDSALIRNNTFTSSSIYGIKISSSDTVVVDNNTLSSNSNYGLYISSADEVIIKSNTISDNQAGIYITGSDDAILSLNSIDDQTTYGVYLADSKRAKIKQNMIKNSQKDEALLYLTEFSDLYMMDMLILQKQLPYA